MGQGTHGLSCPNGRAGPRRALVWLVVVLLAGRGWVFLSVMLSRLLLWLLMKPVRQICGRSSFLISLMASQWKEMAWDLNRP